MQVERLKSEIEALPEDEYIRLWQWFAEKDWERWDRQIESDVASGKLDFLIEEVLVAKEQDR